MTSTDGAANTVGLISCFGLWKKDQLPRWQEDWEDTELGKNDFFGDGRSDIILQNTDGSIVLWDMSGTAIVNAGLVGNPGASWSVEDTASGTAITPGSGSFTDSSGNVFTVSTAGLAEKNGSPLPLGSGTAKLVYYDGIVYGQDVATGNWNILDARRPLVQIVRTWFLRRR